MMAVSPLLLLELVLYACCFICGIVTAASLTIVQGNLGGVCVLYGTVKYNGSAIDVSTFSPSSLCYFVSAISIMVAVVCFSLVLYWVYTLCMEGDVRRERMWLNLIIFVSGVFLFFLLITGCVLKIGRDTFCDSIQKTVKITSCEQAQNKTWAGLLHGEKFYSNLHKAETAVWVNFFFWLIIGVLVIVQQRRASGSTLVPGPPGALFGDSATTSAETEPFFNRPGRPQ